MSRFKLFRSAVCVALCLLGVGVTPFANAVPVYTVTDIGSLGAFIRPTAINNAGQVVGYSGNNGNSYHAFLFGNGTLSDLGTLPGGNPNQSAATGINDTGQVVGYSRDATGFNKAFIYSNGTMSALPVGGFDNYAAGIANDGMVAGFRAQVFPPYYESYIYTNGVVSVFSSAPTLAMPYAVSNNGNITGDVATSTAFLYSNGQMTLLPPIGDSPSFTRGLGVNNSGQVAGFAGNFAPGNAYHGFLYSGGIMIDLGTLGGHFSYAPGINNLGQVVGSSTLPGDSAWHAFLYSDGQMLDLSLDVTLANGATLTDAFGINDVGQIIAIGSDGHAFLLTPKAAAPEPATLALLGLGLAGLGFSRRRKLGPA